MMRLSALCLPIYIGVAHYVCTKPATKLPDNRTKPTRIRVVNDRTMAMRLFAEREFGESLTQMFGFGFPDRQRDGAIGVECLADDTGRKFFDNAHHIVHHGIGEIIFHQLFDLTGDDFGVVECFPCRLSVCHDESARTQIDASVISHDDDEHVGEFERIDLSEDGFAGCSSRFAVIVGSEVLAFMSQHIGIANVSCVVVAFAIVVKQLSDFVEGFDKMRKGEELTPFLGVNSLAGMMTDSFVFVNHLYYDSLWITKPLRNLGSNHVALGGMMLPLSAMSMICCIDTG